jgi:hypothetical protein
MPEVLSEGTLEVEAVERLIPKILESAREDDEEEQTFKEFRDMKRYSP